MCASILKIMTYRIFMRGKRLSLIKISETVNMKCSWKCRPATFSSFVFNLQYEFRKRTHFECVRKGCWLILNMPLTMNEHNLRYYLFNIKTVCLFTIFISYIFYLSGRYFFNYSTKLSATLNLVWCSNYNNQIIDKICSLF